MYQIISLLLVLGMICAFLIPILSTAYLYYKEKKLVIFPFYGNLDHPSLLESRLQNLSKKSKEVLFTFALAAFIVSIVKHFY